MESRGNLVTSGELAHVYHLVKVEADEGDDGEKRGKIMSEVFLTRLLSTKVTMEMHYIKCTIIVYETQVYMVMMTISTTPVELEMIPIKGAFLMLF